MRLRRPKLRPVARGRFSSTDDLSSVSRLSLSLPSTQFHAHALERATTLMPAHPYRTGNYLPLREERSAAPCRVRGRIPHELSGGQVPLAVSRVRTYRD